MVSEEQVKEWINKLEEHKTAIGKERDGLQELLSEIEELEENCNIAIDDIDGAIESLSYLC